MFYSYMPSPVGQLLLAGDGKALHRLGFTVGPKGAGANSEWTEKAAPFRDAKAQLKEYFAGKRKTFELELAPTGTDFQLSVWRALLEIPYGETFSYLDIATNVGNPKAVRAVGAANGLNPIAIVVPCHRVIGSNGKLTGFGGGLPNKQLLLELEKNNSGLFA